MVVVLIVPLRAAGQVAIDDWMQKMGPAAAPILDAYKRTTRTIDGQGPSRIGR
jgi:hypothetical protein